MAALYKIETVKLCMIIKVMGEISEKKSKHGAFQICSVILCSVCDPCSTVWLRFKLLKKVLTFKFENLNSSPLRDNNSP